MVPGPTRPGAAGGVILTSAADPYPASAESAAAAATAAASDAAASLSGGSSSDGCGGGGGAARARLRRLEARQRGVEPTRAGRTSRSAGCGPPLVHGGGDCLAGRAAVTVGPRLAGFGLGAEPASGCGAELGHGPAVVAGSKLVRPRLRVGGEALVYSSSRCLRLSPRHRDGSGLGPRSRRQTQDRRFNVDPKFKIGCHCGGLEPRLDGAGDSKFKLITYDSARGSESDSLAGPSRRWDAPDHSSDPLASELLPVGEAASAPVPMTRIERGEAAQLAGRDSLTGTRRTLTGTRRIIGLTLMRLGG